MQMLMEKVYYFALNNDHLEALICCKHVALDVEMHLPQ